METKHTPGPWHLGMKPGPMIYGPNGEQVADLSADMVFPDETAANARLIAAAPDLLATLLMAESYDPGADWAIVARRAIHNATGGTQ